MRTALRPLLLSFFVGSFISLGVQAQSTELQDDLISVQNLDRVNQLIDYNKNDSALIFLEPIWEQLVEQELTESPFAMQVQLAQARILEQDHLHSDAILLFNQLKAKSKAREQWGTYVNTCFSLAHFYDKMYRKQRSKEHLDLAQNAITQHQLDSLKPSLFIRQAFWNYSFRQHPDSVKYYLQKALSIAKDTTITSPGLLYSWYHLKAATVFQREYKEAFEWYQKAVAMAKKLNDPVRMSATWHEMSKIVTMKEAFTYNDSTIQACYRAIANGHERIHTLHKAYTLRAQFLKGAGQLDSAFYYLNKGLRQELAYNQQQQFERVAEIDASYQDEQKTAKLEEQTRIILYDRRIRYLLIAIIIITLSLAIGLTYGLYIRKITLQKLADKNRLIQEQTEQLKSLDAAKSRFFANVSHELRTPLTLILGPVKTILKSNTLDNRNFTLLTMVRQNAQSLMQLVSSILDLSRMEHSKLKLEEQAESLFPLVRRIISSFESHAQREGIELTFDYQVEEGLQLQLDRIKLQNMLNNLLSNAIKFTPSGGQINVTVQDKTNAILFSVKDTGRGITPNDLPHVFDRFYQSEEENVPTEGGTGIGLAFCKELATVMEGKIWVESQPGAGSTFFVELPRKEVLGVPAELEEELPEIPVTLSVNGKPDQSNAATFVEDGRLTILVVEDNYSLRDYLTTILEPHYKVVCATNGKEALKLLGGESNGNQGTICDPSLIISDVMMPFMDGFQLMEILKSDDRYKHLPLIMLTARADIRDKLKALRIGVDDYLLKPFDEQELLVRISNLLENFMLRKELVNGDSLSPKEIPAISKQDYQWLETFETYIQQNLSNERMNVPEIAHQFAMSESSLLRQLKYLTGLTPAKYLQEMRLDKARQLLEQHVYNSVSKVAQVVGYSDARSFTRNFKKRYGMSPSEFVRTGKG
ncbi:MAG: ATP-binding protein [Bacteroidota bacterium]